MEIWTGSISIKSGPDLKIKLLSPSQRCEKFLLRDTKLSLHSLVNPALVPLHVRAGPSVELHSTTYETSEWLKSTLLRGIWLAEDNDDGIFERFDTVQCPVGLMVDVSSSSNDRSSANHVSDLLIYGILSSCVGESQSRPPSPPESSSILREDSLHAYPVIRRDLKIYVAPLSSSFADKLHSLPSPPASAAGDDTELDKGKDATFATFFPDVRSPSSKRKRILSLFEGAAEHHRRVQQCKMIPQISSIKIKKEVEDNINPAALGSPTLGQTNLRRARSLSVGGHHLSKLSESIGASETRPGSSKGVTDRRDSKSKLGMTHFPSPDNCESTRSQSVVAPSQSTGLPKPTSLNATPSQTNSQLSRPISSGNDLLVAQNKDLITRTILTCMRLYGYNRQTSQTNRLTKSPYTVESREQSHEPNRHQQRDMSIVPDFINAPAEEDDFKTMYHATYKAAMFALRYYLRTASTDMKPPILTKDTAMIAVDGILKLFCDDSLKPGS